VALVRESDEKGLLTVCTTPCICCGNLIVEPSVIDNAPFTDQGIRLVNSRAAMLEMKL
jgi:hypothetical protein